MIDAYTLMVIIITKAIDDNFLADFLIEIMHVWNGESKIQYMHLQCNALDSFFKLLKPWCIASFWSHITWSIKDKEHWSISIKNRQKCTDMNDKRN